MGQKKLLRFAEIATFPNVLQHPENMPGKWKDFFKNDNPIILELACGKGEYAVGLGGMHINKNFIGIDLKGNRIWAGAKKALANNLHNVAFLRTQIDKLTDYFAPGEISEIWITFPDPQLRISRAKKRLTHPKFLRIYQQILKRDGKIHLKTDSPDLYAFTRLVAEMYRLNVITDIEDIYHTGEISEELKIKTYYETLDIAQSNRVHYLCFTIPDYLPDAAKDQELKSSLKEKHEEVI